MDGLNSVVLLIFLPFCVCQKGSQDPYLPKIYLFSPGAIPGFPTTHTLLERTLNLKLPKNHQYKKISYFNQVDNATADDTGTTTITAKTTEVPEKLPIQYSVGDLTGLTSLPPISIVQMIKLLVAVFPFILPLIFVPLMMFSAGIFFYPVSRVHYVHEDDPNQGTFIIQHFKKFLLPLFREYDDLDNNIKPQKIF